MKRIRRGKSAGDGRLLAGAVVLTILACGPDPEPFRETGSAGQLAYVMRESRRTEEGCTRPGSRECARIVLEYPEFVQAPALEAGERINAHIRSWLLAPLTNETPADSVDDLLDGFMRGYREFKADFPESAPVWFAERKVVVNHLSPVWLGLRSEEFTFTGGAHPNTWIVFSNFRAATGEEIVLEDLVGEGGIDAITAVAERKFREVRGLGPDDPLDAAGFWFEDGRFALNDNFSLEVSGLTFYYNRYEIAPYAMGPTGISVSWAEIGEWLRPGTGIP